MNLTIYVDQCIIFHDIQYYTNCGKVISITSVPISKILS